LYAPLTRAKFTSLLLNLGDLLAMDTLAYLHLAETYEASINSGQENIPDFDLCFPEIDWGQEQRGALMLFLSFALGVSSLGWANTAQALKKGEKSPQVAYLQQKLQAAGYFRQAVTGYYGPITEAAVKKFQKAHGIKADGVVGSETLAVLKSTGTVNPSSVTIKPAVTSSGTVNPSPGKTQPTVNISKKPPSASSQVILQRGDLSYEVMSLQRKLQASGYFDQPITGDFNAATEAAVIKFQKAHRLVGNGMVDKQTLAALESGSAKKAVSASQPNTPPSVVTPQKRRSPQTSLLRRGDISTQVKSVQEQLQAAGYFDQPITGDFNAATEVAVIKFQKAHGLIGHGMVDKGTLAALETGSVKKAVSPSQPKTPPSVVTPQKMRSPRTSLLRRGDISTQVKSVQQQLQTAGYFEKSITGTFDVATEIAVVKFQKAHGLIADGIVGPKTLTALKVQSSKSVAPKPGVIDKSKQLKNPNLEKLVPTPKVHSTKVASAIDVSDRQDSSVINQPQQLNNLTKEVTPPASETNSPKLISSPSETTTENSPTRPHKMRLKKVISGKISPKSVVHSGNGLFFAQNMMYNHTITVYNRQHKLVKVIPDKVDLSKYGYSKFKGNYQGAPVEASFSQDGKYAWISNYQMYGPGFNNPGSDKCNPSQKTDKSFLYRIDTETLEIDHVIQVGSVPKFVDATNDERLVLVSNWCSWDLSVVDTAKNREIKRIKLGPYPRGIAIDTASNKAYIAVMGSYDIAKVDLKDFSVKWLKNIGRSPRHLNIDPTGQYLYASLNGEGKIAKINLPQGKLISKVSSGNAPRSMVLSDDGERLYVVNYSDNTVSKVSTSNMKVVQKIDVGANPIGITYDPQTREVWVACYSGNIMVFQD
jgi:YVTN family beta-propeller protein